MKWNDIKNLIREEIMNIIKEGQKASEKIFMEEHKKLKDEIVSLQEALNIVKEENEVNKKNLHEQLKKK